MKGETATATAICKTMTAIYRLRSVIYDEGQATATMTMGELRRPRSEYWGFGLVLPFWYRGSVLGFFFFFLINTVYCFWFVLLLLCKL